MAWSVRRRSGGFISPKVDWIALRPMSRDTSCPDRVLGAAIADNDRQVMHDPVGIGARIDRVVARVDRRDDYGHCWRAAWCGMRLTTTTDVFNTLTGGGDADHRARL
jgi:hypothetical protein